MSNANFEPSTIWTADNLLVLRGMNSESVDLIYLDPPYNSKANYASPVGVNTEGFAFKDTWSLNEIEVEWLNLLSANHEKLHSIIQSSLTDSNKSYLVYMSVRILEMHRILKSTGSIFLHCDPQMSHWLKIVLDCIFRPTNFRNEIIWHYGTGSNDSEKYLSRSHDIIFWYSKIESQSKCEKYIEMQCSDSVEESLYYEKWKDHFQDGNKILFGNHPENDSSFKNYLKNWKQENGRDPQKGDVVFECKGDMCNDVWNDIKRLDPSSSENIQYPTQKPIKLLNRIIRMSSDVGDVIFDPFCGTGTTLVAAEQLNRKWIGIDISATAAELVKKRITENPEQFISNESRNDRGIIELTIEPSRTDIEKLPHYESFLNTLYREQGGECKGCKKWYKLQNLSIDHIIPVSHGGTNQKENLQLLCQACNSMKGKQGMANLKSKLKLVKSLDDLGKTKTSRIVANS